MRFAPLFLFLICGYLATAQNVGDFRTSGSGVWLNPGIWERYNGSTWSAAATPPNGTSGVIIIQNMHSVSVGSGQTVTADEIILAGELTVETTGTFIVANGSGIDLMLVNAGASLVVHGSLIRQDLSQISNPFTSDNIRFEAGSVYDHQFTNSVGEMPPATWSPTSTLLFSSFANATNISGNSTWDQAYGNIVFNSPAQRAVVDFNGHIKSIKGNLSVQNTGKSILRLSNTSSYTLELGEAEAADRGNVIVSGTARIHLGVSNTINATIYGDFVVSAANLNASYITSTGTAVVNIYGDLRLTNSSARLRLGAGGSTGNSILNLYGDFINQGGRLDETGDNPTQGTLNFVKNGTQTFSNQGVIVGRINYYIGPTTTLEVGNSLLSGSSPATFTLEGTIVLGSLDSYGAIHSSANRGNIRTAPAYRTFAPGSTIVYGGAGEQFMSNGHPLNDEITTVIRNSSGVKLVANTTIAGTLNLDEGSLDLNGRTLTLTGIVASNGGFLAGTPTSELIINGSPGSAGTLAFDPSANALGKITMNRADGTVSLTNTLVVASSLNLNRGIIVTNNNLTLRNNVLVLRYDSGQLSGGSPNAAAGERYHVEYRTFSPSSGPSRTYTTGDELPAATDALGNLTIRLQLSTDRVTLSKDIAVNGTMLLERGSFSLASNYLTMNGPSWQDNGGILVTGSAGAVIFNGTTNVNGSADPVFGNIQVAATGNVNFMRNLNVEGNVGFASGSNVNFNEKTVTFSGSNPQTVSANGATFSNINIAKGSGQGITLVSQLNLSGIFQFSSPSSNVNVQSNGHLNLLSTSDGGGAGTARVYRLLNDNRISGDVTVNRFMSPEGRVWRYISSPVSNSSVAQLQDDFFVGGNFVDPSPKQEICGKTAAPKSTTIYYYDEAVPGGMEEGYVEYPRPGKTAAESPLHVGLGYSVFIRNCETPTVIDFAGPLNQGTLTLPVTYTANDPQGDGWNLVGNPYPSAIDWDAGGWTKTRISSQIAIRDYAADVFRYYEAGVTNEIQGGQIAMGQAFWVRATGPNPVLRITENAKVTSVAEFFRESAPRIPNFMLALSDGLREDYAYVKTVVEAKTSLDDFDAPKIMNQTISLSTVASDNVPMAINAVESLTCGMVIPVRTDGLQPGRYSFRLDTREYFSEFAFILRDRYSDREVTLSSETYEFVVDENPASANINRFEIRVEERMAFSDVVVATENICSDNVTIAINNADRDVKYAVWNTGGFAVSDVLTATSSRLSIALPAESVQSGEFVIKAISVCGSEGVVSAPFSLDRVLPTVALASTRNCATGSIELAASSNDANAVIRWFEREGDVTPVHTGAVFDVGKLNKTKTYFAEAVSSSGCVSPREQVVAEAAPLVEPELTVAGMKLVVNYATDNRWFFNDELIAENVTSVDLTESGEYRVELAIGGCVSVLNHFQEGVSGLQFYPNPVADKLIFKGITDDVKEITLVNTLGVNILPIYRKGQNFGGEVDVQSLSDGVYLLIVVQSNGKHIHRLVKGSK